jgi:NADH-ubiquinone oxidoreductase chain 4
MQFNNSTTKFQFVETIQWLPYLNFHFYVGMDGIFLFFVVLTTFLIPICILVGWYNIKNYKREYMITFLICDFFMIVVFCMLDFLLFYVFFESVLIPMLCGVEHLMFVVQNVTSIRALCSKQNRKLSYAICTDL